MPGGATVELYRDRILALAAPGGQLYNHWLRTMMQIDARAKYYLEGVMVGKRTGNLLSSQAPPIVMMRGESIVGALQNNAAYAVYVHNGTKPHRIEPVRAKFLRFDPGGAAISAAGTGGQGNAPTGNFIYSRGVNHPGTKARPFLRQAMEDVIAAQR